MRNDSTVFVALDVHQKSIVAAYAVGAGEVEDLGNIGTRHCDLDRLCKRMQSKGSAGALRLRGWAVRLCGVSLSHWQGLRLHGVCAFQGRT